MTAASKPASVSRTWLVGAALLTTAFVGLLDFVPMASNDLWLQLKIGQITLADGAIPRTLLFPFTAVRDAAFNAHEWLPSVLFFEIHRAVGDGGLMFVLGLFALLQFGLAVLLARRLSRSEGAALSMATLAMLTLNFRYVLRPELFALLFLTLLLMTLTRYREAGRRSVLGWTVPLAVLWANCHGSFLLGPAACALFAIGEGATALIESHREPARTGLRAAMHAGWPYVAAALAMLLASVVNPRGSELLAFAFQVQGSGAIKGLIKEWLPTLHPLFVAEPAFWIFIAVGLLSSGLLIARRRDVTATEALLFLSFLALALVRNRHIVWFALVSLAACASVVGRRNITAGGERRLRMLAVAMALAGLAACVRFGNARHSFVYESPSNNFTPAMAQELARPDLVGNVFNSYELGSELIWRDWPRLKPSIDSRADSYGDAYLQAHEHLLVDEARLRRFLDAQRVDHMLLLRNDFDNGVRQMPRIAAEWHIRLADAKMVLLERNVASVAPAPASSASAH
jgi:hypothetical protein